jgi:hypothetical protein
MANSNLILGLCGTKLSRKRLPAEVRSNAAAGVIEIACDPRHVLGLGNQSVCYET